MPLPMELPLCRAMDPNACCSVIRYLLLPRPALTPSYYLATQLTALVQLHVTSECDFDLTLSGARLQPIAFGSRTCMERECHYNCFVHWRNCMWSMAYWPKQKLWGVHLSYWICDYAAVKEVLAYNGELHVILDLRLCCRQRGACIKW
eukprot:scaffold3002_cov64-Attheya_sp.AAC.10